MKAKLIAVSSTVIAALVGVVLSVGMALAVAGAPPGPTTPFPAVPTNADVCKAEKIRVAQAQLLYNQALTNYNRILEAFNRGAASAQEVRSARKALDQATLALNNAKYAEATCQNNAANPANKACVNIALELNRLIDELAITKDLEAIAKEDYEAAKLAYERGAMSIEEYERIKTAYEVAKLQTQLIEQLIADQRARATAAGCKDVERPPSPPSPSPTSPAPSSPAPSPTSSPAPSSSSTPSGPTPTSTSTATPQPTASGIVY